MGEGRLYVCATPIGNLGDVTDRLRQVLSGVDLIYAEDTRRAAKLLSHLDIRAPVRSLFAGNEKERSAEVIAKLTEGLDIALVTDAGMPTISDPGAWVVSLAHQRGLGVSVIPGPSSVTTALALTGFPADRFVFEGFLPRKGRERARRLERIAGDDRTTVLFVAPHRISEDLSDLHAVLGDHRGVAVTRELTKLFEEVWVGPIGEAVERWAGEVKGEITVVVSAATETTDHLDTAIARARELVVAGESLSEAARRAAEETGAGRRPVYQALLDDQA